MLTGSLGSEHFDDDDDREAPERFLRTRSTQPPDNYFSAKITRDKVQRIEKEKDRADWPSSSKEVTLFRHNVVTLYTMLEDMVGSPVKPAGSGKARALSCVPSTPLDQADSRLVPLSPYLVHRPSDLSKVLGRGRHGE